MILYQIIHSLNIIKSQSEEPRIVLTLKELDEYDMLVISILNENSIDFMAAKDSENDANYKIAMNLMEENI